jgi:hypothetical protein
MITECTNDGDTAEKDGYLLSSSTPATSPYEKILQATVLPMTSLKVKTAPTQQELQQRQQYDQTKLLLLEVKSRQLALQQQEEEQQQLLQIIDYDNDQQTVTIIQPNKLVEQEEIEQQEEQQSPQTSQGYPHKNNSSNNEDPSGLQDGGVENTKNSFRNDLLPLMQSQMKIPQIDYGEEEDSVDDDEDIVN